MKPKKAFVPYISMEYDSVVISTFTQSDEILAGSGSYIAVQLNVQITVGCVQLYIAFLRRVLLDFDVFKFIFGDRIKSRGSE